MPTGNITSSRAMANATSRRPEPFRWSPIAARSRPASFSPSSCRRSTPRSPTWRCPIIQGSVSASADQINWVLTSYIVAAAIMTPPSGFLAANRFGRKRVLLTAIAGFVIASSAVRAWRSRSTRSSLSACCRACSAPHSCRCLKASCSTSIRARRARLGHGAVRRLGHGWSGSRPGDRRLADRSI